LSLIGIAGVKLTRYGDAIADKTGLGRTWVGVLLLASVTSLPELATGINSVTIASALLFMLYAVTIRTVFGYEMKHVGEFTDQEPDRYPHGILRRSVLRYLVAAAVVVGAGVWLPFIGGVLAEQMGWNETFVGTLSVRPVLMRCPAGWCPRFFPSEAPTTCPV
jgi:cation:H+ antiporter